jgi:hypothetical protein
LLVVVGVGFGLAVAVLVDLGNQQQVYLKEQITQLQLVLVVLVEQALATELKVLTLYFLPLHQLVVDMEQDLQAHQLQVVMAVLAVVLLQKIVHLGIQEQ